jgi:PilZ domain
MATNLIHENSVMETPTVYLGAEWCQPVLICAISTEGLGIALECKWIMSPNPSNREARKKSRKSPPSLIYVELGPGNGGMMRDMSEEGFALRAMIPVQAGEKTPFSFLLDTDVRIEGQGEILWIKENGRVAGVRFLEIPSLARRQIRSWLTGTLDTLETPESAEEPTVPEAQSFDELRKELRAPAPRPTASKPHWAVPRTRPPETVPEAPAAIPDVTSQGMSAGVLAGTAVDPPRAQDAEPPADAGAFPGLPNFSATQQAIEHTFEALPPAPLVVQNAAPPLVVPGVRATVAEEDIASPTKTGPRDISAILMQPRSKEREFSANVPALEPLDPLGHSHGVSQIGRPWFTFSRAVTFMILLALAVGIYAYRQPAGQFLIWLGEQLGGTQASQTSSPASNNGVSTSAADPSSSNPSEPSTPAPHAAATGGNQESAGHSNSSGQAALPSTEKSSLPQVTPFSGISSLPPETGQETGLAEYSRAMQLLHGTHSDADTSEAVRLLWISVEKGNPSAELTLADLYWHGQGVGRNCDQARILLSAAARKGNADAQKGLKRIQQEGCE